MHACNFFTRLFSIKNRPNNTTSKFKWVHFLRWLFWIFIQTFNGSWWHFRIDFHIWCCLIWECSIALLLEVLWCCCLRSWVKNPVFPAFPCCCGCCCCCCCWGGCWRRSKLRWLEAATSIVLLLMSILIQKSVLWPMITNLTEKKSMFNKANFSNFN